jgi:hypothetical protein
MRCDWRRCDRCKEPTLTYVLFVRPCEPADEVVCLACVTVGVHAPPLPPVDHTGLTEAKCDRCGHLFAGDPEHGARFCSLACEEMWQRASDEIPF